MKILTFFILILGITGLYSCGKKEAANSASSTLDIYAVGYVNNGSATQAIYWKNEVPVLLPPATQSLTGNSYGFSMAVSGSDIYVVGFSPSGPGFWKNGNPMPLPGPVADVRCIAVSGSDVFIAGEEWSNGLQCATYWKNGNPVILTDTTVAKQDEKVYGIFIAGNDLYVCGSSVLDGINSRATYWKNGVPVLLGNDSVVSAAYSIFVSGNDVYAAGFQNNDSLPAIYWKNGSAIHLADGTTKVNVTAIGVSGNDVYVTGNEYNPDTKTSFALYWKNGQPIYLADKSLDFWASSIAFSQNDVYIGGNTSSSATYSNDVATYWKNGTAVTLPYSNNHRLQNVSSVLIVGK